MHRRPVPTAQTAAAIAVAFLFAFHFCHTDAGAAKGGKDRTPPTLTVDSPVDGFETGDPLVTVAGRTADDRAVASVGASINGGAEIPLSLLADGSFSGRVILSPGENAIVVTARDEAGNETAETRAAILLEAPPPVTFTSPRDGDVIHGDSVDVLGTYEDPVRNMGYLTFIGVAGGGTFDLPSYPLEEGENVIRVTGVDSEGNEYPHEITVTRVGGGEPVTITPDRASGEAPLTVHFLVETDTSETPAHCEIDYRGDGQFVPLPDCSDGGRFSYESSRFYIPAVRMHTVEGHRYSAVARISTHGPATYLAEFPADNPVDMEMDEEGNLYVLEGSAGRVVVMDPSGTIIRTFGSPGVGDGQFTNPAGIELDSDGRVYVSDTGNSRVQLFSAAGDFLGTWGSRGTRYGELMSPQGIAIGHDGEMIVADSANGRVESMHKENGHWYRSIGEAELASPADVLWLPGIDCAVSDKGTGEVMVFSPYGGAAKKLRQKAGPFVSPAGLSYDKKNGYVVIADEGSNTVFLTKYADEAFVTVRIISMLTGDPKGLAAPKSALRGLDEIEDIYYIADSGNNRVVKLRLETGPAEDPLAVWSQVREALAGSDVEGALAHFSLQTQEKYRQIFTSAEGSLPQVAADMSELHQLSYSEQGAVYGVLRYDNEQPFLFEVHFVRDALGGWKVLFW